MSVQAERAALAALAFVEAAGDRVAEITGGLDADTRAEVCELLADPAFTRQDRDRRESRMVDLAGQKSRAAEVSS